jgi:hypothetical protein
MPSLGDERSNSRAISSSSPRGPSRRAGAGSCAAARRRRRARLERGALRARVELRVPQQLAELGHLALASTKSPSSSRTGSTLPCSLRGSKSARAYVRCDDRHCRSPSEHREVELADRLVDQALVVGVVERPCRVTFSAAISVSSATSERICSSARASRPRSAARLLEPPLPVGLELLAHALALRLGDAPRLGEDLLASCAPARSARGAPRAASAPPARRGRPPRATARIRSRRSSIISGSGRTRSASSTKSVIRKQTIVQIISPGVTWISGFVRAASHQTRTKARIEPSRP